MKRSTRMLLMNSGKNSQNRERTQGQGTGEYGRGYQPDPNSTGHVREDRDGEYAVAGYHGMAYPMGRTGFSLSGEIGRAFDGIDRKHHSMDGHTSGMPYQQAAPQYNGLSYEDGTEYTPLSRSMAVEWTRDMENSDGTHGPHWNMEQVNQVMEQREIDCDPVKFFAVLNAVYSDYYAVAKKHGVNKMDFYADLAKAWLEDSDAVEDKAGKYFRYIVKH